MAFATLLKLLHVLSAFWFITGLLGRGFTLSQAARTADVQTVSALVQLGGRFDRLMVMPGSFAVLLAGLLTAWAQGWPVLGFLQGGSSNWVLVSLVIYLSMVPLIPGVFIPRGKLFENVLQEALAQNRVTPELKAAFADKVVSAAHAYELIGVALIVILMVTKPF